MLHHIVREQIVLQVGVGQAIRGNSLQVCRLAVGLLPAGIHVLGLNGLLGQIAVFADIVNELGGVVGAVLVLHAGPPAKVVQAVVLHVQVLGGLAHDVAHAAQGAHRHIADVDDLGVGPQHTAGLCHDGGRVGVVEHPAVGAVLFHVVDQLHDVGNAAHAIGHAAGAAGLLTHYAVAQGDLFVLLTHGIAAAADVCHAEIHIGKGLFGVGGIAEGHIRSNFLHGQGHSIGNDLLTLGVIVVQLQATDREPIQTVHQHHNDTRRIGTAAAGDHNRKLFHGILPSLLLDVFYKSIQGIQLVNLRRSDPALHPRPCARR